MVEKTSKPLSILGQIGQSPSSTEEWGRSIPPMTIYAPHKSISKKRDADDLPFDQERSRINSAIDTAEEIFNNRFRTGSLPEGFQINTWVGLEKDRVKIHNESIALMRNVENSNPETSARTAMIALLKMTKNLLLTEVMDNQASLTDKYGFIDCYRPLAQASKDKTCSEAFIKIGGFSIVDFFRGGKIEYSQYLQSAVEATVARGDYSYSKIISENTDNPTLKNYPNMGGQAVHNACEQLSIFSVISPEIFELIKVPCHSKTERKIISEAREITEQAVKIRKDLLNAIFSPDIPDFPALSKTLRQYLTQENDYIRTQILMKFGLSDPKSELWTYQTATKIRDGDDYEQHRDFYTLFMRAIKTFVKEYPQVPQVAEIATIEDALKFLPDNNSEGIKLPSFEELRKINEQILEKSLTSELQYEISPSFVDFHGTETLKNIKLKFLFKADPTKIYIFLYGSETNFAIAVNTKKKQVYWNSLEDLKDPKMQGMKNEAILLAHSVLFAVQKQVETAYQEKRERKKAEAARAHTIFTVPKAPKKDRHDEHHQRSIKKEKPVSSAPLSPIEKPLPPPSEKKEIKSLIVFPENKRKIYKLMRHISKENQKIIFAEIKRHNHGEITDLKMLTDHIKHDKKPVYELVINDYRVLMTMMEPVKRSNDGVNQGKPKLEIYAIGNRKIYSKGSHGKNYY